MLKNFFCCSLKTGSLAIAVINLVAGVGFIVICCVEGPHVKDKDDDLFYFISACFAAINIVKGLILIAGIVMGKHYFVLIWVITSAVEFTMATIFTGINMFRQPLYAILFVMYVVFWYCWLCVLNFYQELRIYNLGLQAAFLTNMITVPGTEFTEQTVC